MTLKSRPGSKTSATFWEFIGIIFILIMIPVSVGVSQGILTAPEEEVEFAPDNSEEISSWEYKYENETGTSETGGALYYKYETGSDYHELIALDDTDNVDLNGTFEKFQVDLNYTVSDALDDGIASVDFVSQWPYSGEIQMGLYAKDSSGNTMELDSTSYNTPTETEELKFDFQTVDLLYAEDQTSSDAELIVRAENEGVSSATEDGNVLPPDGSSLLFQIEANSDYSADPLISLNAIGALWGMLLIPLAIFSTPWVDPWGDFLSEYF